MRKPHLLGQQMTHGVIGLEIDPSPLSDFRPIVISNLFTKATDGNENVHGGLLFALPRQPYQDVENRSDRNGPSIVPRSYHSTVEPDLLHLSSIAPDHRIHDFSAQQTSPCVGAVVPSPPCPITQLFLDHQALASRTDHESVLSL
jgi:hypothetical protein